MFVWLYRVFLCLSVRLLAVADGGFAVVYQSTLVCGVLLFIVCCVLDVIVRCMMYVARCWLLFCCFDVLLFVCLSCDVCCCVLLYVALLFVVAPCVLIVVCCWLPVVCCVLLYAGLRIVLMSFVCLLARVFACCLFIGRCPIDDVPFVTACVRYVMFVVCRVLYGISCLLYDAC